MTIVVRPTNAFIAAPELSASRSTYISTTDLIEVLHDYYDGQIDRPTLPELIPQDLSEWHPNTLWCRVDSQQLDRLLSLLPPYQREALRYSLHHPFNEKLIQHQYVTHYQGTAEYWEFIDRAAAAAFEHLSELLLEDLNYA